MDSGYHRWILSRPMLTPGFKNFMKEERSSKSPAGHPRDASSTRFISRIPRPSQPKRSSASPRSTPSKPRSEAAPPMYAKQFVRRGPLLCSITYATGWKTHSRSSRASPIRRRRSATPSRAGMSSIDMPTMANWRSTTTPPNARCASSPSDAKTSSSRDRTLGGERAAAIYSLLGSAKLNGLDPELYLHHVLDQIADHPISRISDLLPWNVSLPTQSGHY